MLSDAWFAKVLRGPSHSILHDHSDDTEGSALPATSITTHASRHQDGGADELDIYGLDFLVGTATGVFATEIVAGTAPGGELGGTWASPTVDSTHSGSAHQIHARVRKGSDETTSTDETLSDDGALLFAIAASETWAFEFHVYYDAAAGDFEATITVPTGATGNWAGNGVNTSGAYSSRMATFAAALTFDASTTAAELLITGTVVNSTNAGNVTLQWAQDTSNAATLTVRASSYLIAHRIA